MARQGRIHGCGAAHIPSTLSPMPSSALVAVVIVVMVSVAAGINDAAAEQPTGQHQRDHRDEFDAHGPILNSGSGSHTPEEADTGSPPTVDVPPNADAAPSVGVPAHAHAPLDGVPSSEDRTRLHPSRLVERRATARQVGLTGDEPWLKPPFRLPASQELQSQP